VLLSLVDFHASTLLVLLECKQRIRVVALVESLFPLPERFDVTPEASVLFVSWLPAV
jgi:hypothetical protein